MQPLEELYWDTHCDQKCGCRNLKEALMAHPELRKAHEMESREELPVLTVRHKGKVN